jgi:hypothetical protein
VDAAADESLSLSGGQGFQNAAESGLALAAEAGLEIVEIPEEERARWMEQIATATEAAHAERIGARTVGELVAIMQGE